MQGLLGLSGQNGVWTVPRGKSCGLRDSAMQVARSSLVMSYLFVSVVSCGGPARHQAHTGHQSERRVVRAAPLGVGIAFTGQLPHMDTGKLARRLDDVAALGARWIRVDLSWAEVQRGGANTFEWANFDRVVTQAHSRNIEVLPVLAYSPAWARPSGCGDDKCGPANAADFGRFAAAAAQRYSSLGVHYWEIWNEQNLARFWAPKPSVVDYVKLVRDASVAIRAVDGMAHIVAGGLAATRRRDGVAVLHTAPPNVAPLEFLQEACENGIGDYVDSVGYHPYTFPLVPGGSLLRRAPNSWDLIEKTRVSFSSILRDCGSRSPDVWLTEFGAPTEGGANGGGMLRGTVSEREGLQAEIASSAVKLANGSQCIGALFWYTDADSGDTGTQEGFFGLRRADGSAKPGYAALRDGVRAIRS